MPVIVDSYSESNCGGYYQMSSNADDSMGCGQSFTGDGGVLNSVKFYLKKITSITGTAYVKIYAHTGTFGTSSLPTGSALAISDVFDVSTLTTSFQLITFTFTGAEKITLTNETKYIATFEYQDDGTNVMAFGVDYTGNHNGNFCRSIEDLVSWEVNNPAHDACFYVYGESYASPLPAFRRPTS